MKLSIVIPVYNEENTVEAILKEVCDVQLPYDLEKEVVVVNDGSTDATAEILKKYGDDVIKVFHQPKNAGKTSAILRGFDEATGDLLLIQDADLEYLPASYPDLLKPIIEDKKEVVYGSRFKGNIKNMKLINRLANNFSNFSFNILYGTKLTDINTCYKLFSKDLFKQINITSQRFAFETEFSAKMIKKGIDIIEVPINYDARTVQEGKKINFSYALEMYFGMFGHK
ncbi:MAG: glycosyltransferase involved in cell wall biosynthesis [Lysobacterales bacterium]|jgi:glycosyltransferase involved in cell wall biosynthesis